MDAMMYVGMASALAALVSGRMIYRHKQNKKRVRYPKHRFIELLDDQDRKRKTAVRELNKSLRHKLDSFAFEGRGMGAMIVAQRIAEEVFYEWLNHNFGLFYCAMADSKIEVYGTHNGLFQYRLPQQLEQYKG